MFDEILELMKGTASNAKEWQPRIQDVKQRHEINISKQKINASIRLIQTETLQNIDISGMHEKIKRSNKKKNLKMNTQNGKCEDNIQIE